MGSNNTEYDDLTKIKGIRATRQQWLQETFNVRTYKDLATLTPDAIEAKLKAEGRLVARGDIERWLAQAQELVVAAGQLGGTEEAAAQTLPQKKSKLADKTEAWRQIAMFTVEFRERIAADQPTTYQTVVQHMETDTEDAWPGIETKALCAWMLGQVGDKVGQKTTEDGPVTEGSLLETKSAPTSPIPVTITQVRIFQPPNANTPSAIGEPGRPLEGIIRSAQPFALEATFQIDAPSVALRTMYQTQFFVRSLATGTNVPLGSTKPVALATDQVVYTAKLAQASLQLGIYRLQVLVSLQSRSPSTGYLEIPMLQVV